ncbi:hypothetical protein LXL04_026604 [Taraxacum kok-saghyz]
MISIPRAVLSVDVEMRMASGKTWMSMFWLLAIGTVSQGAVTGGSHRNAYATMMYMGTPRDYEFYVAIRVMLRSLSKLRVDADLVVIASPDVPLRWIRTLEEDDGAKVVRVENLKNPYQNDTNHDRFKLTLNKLYAWSLVEYERVVMLDADNLFLQNTDELFQCGHFCAVFINPCIFHTGLFVVQKLDFQRRTIPSLICRRRLSNGLAMTQIAQRTADFRRYIPR